MDTRRPRGVTLIEVLVVVAVVGMLAAIAVPAVMYARQGAGRAQCAGNLRQMALALTGYGDIHGSFPPNVLAGSRPFASTVWGTHVMLLPYLEQEALYERLNLSANLASANGENTTAMQATPAVYLCPSDSRPKNSVGGQLIDSAFHNYSICGGNGFTVAPDTVMTERIQLQSQVNGLFQARPVRPADVTDGLSRTAAFAERLHGEPDVNVNMDEDAKDWRPRTDTTYGMIMDVPTPQNAHERCQNLDGPRGGLPNNNNWLWDIGYTHQSTPNQPSCWPASPMDAWDGSLTASSRHAGGVNVAFADGHVPFVSDAVDLHVWRAAATRAGGEQTDGL